jgi:hypothetical protein
MSPDSMTSGWYYAKAGAPAGHETGPISWVELFMLAHEGTISPADIVWNPKLPRGVTAGLVPGLFPLPEVPRTPQAAAPQPMATKPAAPQPVIPQPVQQLVPKTVEPMWEIARDKAQGPPGTNPTAAQANTEAPDHYVDRLADSESPMTLDELSPAKAERHNRRLPWLIVILILVVAAAGVAAYFLYFRDTSGDQPTGTTASTATAVSHPIAPTAPEWPIPAVRNAPVVSDAAPFAGQGQTVSHADAGGILAR